MTLITIQANDKVKDSRSDINDNFTYLDGKIDSEVSALESGKQDVNTTVLLTGDQTIAGVKTFSSSPIVPAPTTDMQASTKKYVDDIAFAGAPDASTTVKGIVEEATLSEIVAGTASGSEARLFTNPSTLLSFLRGAIETTSGTTHSLTTTAGQKVIVFAKGYDSRNTTLGTVTLKYNGSTMDSVGVGGNGNSLTDVPFSLMYTHTPGAATANITVEGGVSLTNVVIIVLKI